ncbi:MAG: hypothetical protein P1V20_31915, partial [Verrucomicrobiales bacterium]|nr:hypothetical protein [Verrucomicrobiales bacterium]
EPGEWLAAGSPVVSLVSAGEIEAWLEVPERFSSTVSSDPSALTVFGEDGTLSATAKSVKRIAEVDMRSRVFQFVATLDDLEGRLIHGMSVSADLPIGEKEALPAVPVNAVVSSRLGEFVYRAAPPAKAGAMPVAEKIAVTVRFRRDGTAFLAKSDQLKAGDQVVLEGNERLMDGQTLMISQNPKQTNPSASLEVTSEKP